LELVVAANHVGLSLGESRPVALVAAARELRAFAAHDPGHFLVRRLAALGANEIVRALFRYFVEEFPLIHTMFPLPIFFAVGPAGLPFDTACVAW